MQRSPKPYYAGSSPVTSAFGLSPRWLRHSTLTAVFVGSNPTSPALYAVVMQNGIAAVLKTVVRKGVGIRVLYAVLWSHRQVVKTTVCKTVIVGSNPTVTSRM